MSSEDDVLDEVVREFLVESAENLDQLDRDLVSLEKDPNSRELLGSIFRAVHTVKGTTGFLGFARLEEVAHRAENLLSKLRDGALDLDSARTTALLEVIDRIRSLLAHIEATGNDEDGRDDNELLARLATLQQPAASAPQRPSRTPRRNATGAAASTAAEAAATLKLALPQEAAPAKEVAPAKETAATAPARGAALPPAAPAQTAAPTITAAERTVRVDVELLDTLMRQVGELVLARNQLISHSGADGARALQRLSLIVSELQTDVMKTRMQPVEQLWSKLPRVVRDLAKQFAKEVDLFLEGGTTELDRSVLEAVKDPFTHLVRNALDHGIEPPDEREAAGKPRAGSLVLRAYHHGGKVVLEMADDGAGIDPRRVGAKAIQAGLVSPDRLAQMTQREITELVFQPGFSTANAVSNISGRGVGMDVVRTNIERIGGTVDLSSTPGCGTTVRIRIPLTLAIIPALLVECRGCYYALPQAAVQELVRLEGEAVDKQVERVDSALIYRLRGKLLPLLCLDAALGLDPAGDKRALDIVVVQADGEPFGLVVDAVEGTQEIVVKPLTRQLKHLPLYAGATILGDGNVALILDVGGLADTGNVREGRAAARGRPEAGASGTKGAERLLVLGVGGSRRVAVALEQVERLEELDASRVEHAGSRWALQYRGELLPLAWLGDVLGAASGPGDSVERLPIVVCSDGERSVGLVADQILDIVEEVVTVSSIGAAHGVLGTAIVQGRATDLLDLPAAAEHAGVVLRRTVDLALGGTLDRLTGSLDEGVGASAG